MKLQKEQLRKIFKARRALLSEDEIDFFSEKILENFKEFFTKNPQIFENKTIGLYLENKGEVAVSKIAKFLQNQSIKVAYPKIIDLNSSLNFAVVDSKDFFLGGEVAKNHNFCQSKFFKKIFEPKSCEIIEPDILLIPLLAFDLQGFRLGMGGGFYDRSLAFLRQKTPNFLAVGLAFDWQFFEEGLPSEEFDEKLDLVFTPNCLLTSCES